MNDKNRFAIFISEKRKGVNLTQKAFADKLHISETAVSKWERGISYPDISLISGICKILEISEKEFIMATDDIKAKEEQRFIHKVRRNIKYSQLSLMIAYLITIIVCVICNIAIDKKISWSLVVIVSIGIAYSLTILPSKFKNNKIIKSFGVTTILIYLLLLIIKVTTSPDLELIKSLIIATINLATVWALIIINFINNKLFSISLQLIIIGFFVIFINPVAEFVLNGVFDLKNIPDYNLPIGIVIIILGVIILLIKCLKSFFYNRDTNNIK